MVFAKVDCGFFQNPRKRSILRKSALIVKVLVNVVNLQLVVTVFLYVGMFVLAGLALRFASESQDLGLRKKSR